MTEANVPPWSATRCVECYATTEDTDPPPTCPCPGRPGAAADLVDPGPVLPPSVLEEWRAAVDRAWSRVDELTDST